jgi:hypothetical protein
MIAVRTVDSDTDVAQRWDELAGWQRGVLGLLIVVVALFVFMGAMILVSAV